MFKVSSSEFYKRHKNEILKNLFSLKNNLVISNIDSNFKIEIKNIDFLEIDIDCEKDQLFNFEKKYDCIVLSDVAEVSQDLLGLLNKLKSNLNNDGTILLSSINPFWDKILYIFEFLNLKNKSKKRSYIHPNKLSAVLEAINFEIVSKKSRQYFPFKLFKIGNLLNKIFEIILYYFNFGIRTYITIKQKNIYLDNMDLSKTIIIPAKNEEGNLKEIISRIPNLGKDVEVIISCGESDDNTIELSRTLESEKFEIKVIEQTLNGKANAVWEAIEQSSGELIAILDADLSVDPELLTEFFSLIESNRCDFVNGTRLIYSMEKGSMRIINNFGNRLFQYIISLIIRLPLTDSLCGTKVFKRNLYEKIKIWQNQLKINDPFGDFDLLFSAAFASQKIIEYPIHYRARKYGKTQIKRFKDGYKLILYLISSFYLFNTSK